MKDSMIGLNSTTLRL
uniref:Uncharacterized protein n=1 Tax=Arundo donax TaxID=35708 RepID=A0A0A9HQ89_ARUDO